MLRFRLLVILLLAVGCKPAAPSSASIKDASAGVDCAQYEGKDCSCNLACTACKSNAAAAEQFSCVKDIATSTVPGLRTAAKYIEAGLETVEAIKALANSDLAIVLSYFLAFDDNGDPAADLEAAPEGEGEGSKPASASGLTGDQPPAANAPPPPPGDTPSEGEGLFLDEPDPVQGAVDRLGDAAEKKIEQKVDQEIDKFEAKLRKKGDELVDKTGNVILGKIGVNGCTKQGRLAFKATAKAIAQIQGSQGSSLEQGRTIVDAVQKLYPSLDAALGCLSPKAKAKVDKTAGDVKTKILKVFEPIVRKVITGPIDLGQVQVALECSDKIFRGGAVLVNNIGCLLDDLATIREQNRTLDRAAAGLHDAPLGEVRQKVEDDKCFGEPIDENQFLMTRYGSYVFDKRARDERAGTITSSTSNRADLCAAQCGLDGGDGGLCNSFMQSLRDNPETGPKVTPLCSTFCGVRQKVRAPYEGCIQFCCGADTRCIGQAGDSSKKNRVPTTKPQCIGNTLAAGKGLNRGQALCSSDKLSYLFFMQPDGNLVLYNKDYDVLWAADTQNSGADHAAMQGDGNFVVYAGTAAQYDTSTSGANCRLSMQDDGNVVLYCNGNDAVWHTNISAKKR